jgi:O-antigen biosynthesis protein
VPHTVKTASEMLRLPGQTTVAWAVFDAQWYQETYPDTRDLSSPASVLQFYLENGQQRGDSPNIWFDERWHLANHPLVAVAVCEGQVRSGFDSYCREGFRSRSPHWLFNEALYRNRYSDLRDDVLATDNNANGYDHYLKHGSREGRIGHLLFDPTIYLLQVDAEERAEAESAPFAHYLRHIAVRGSERRSSLLFDPLQYLHRYPNVAEEIAKGWWFCALHHYLCNDAPTGYDPLPQFSEEYYLRRYPDIAEAVAKQARRNGYDHFLTNGVSEYRSPIQWIDLRYYVTVHPSVRAELELGRCQDPFAHYLTFGRAQGLAASPPPENQVTEQLAWDLYEGKSDHILPAVARTQLDFTYSGDPAVSVIMLLNEGLAHALRALGSLRSHYRGNIQLILVSWGSFDEQIIQIVHGATLQHFDADIGPVQANNAALQHVTAEAVLFLSSKVELMPGAIAAALSRLGSDPRLRVVGAKLIRGHGPLDSAGGIIWRDGITQSYLHDADPNIPEANFVRDVDCCSMAFLLVHTALIRELEGLDDRLLDEDLVAADLCIRIASAGYRVVYDPAVAAYYFGRFLTGPKQDAAADRAHHRFVQKHMSYLRFRYIAHRQVEIFARSAGSAHRVLFIDDTIPLRRIGSGFVRSNDIIRVMASLGYAVTVYPLSACRFGLATLYSEMPDTVEVMHDRDADSLGAFLTSRHGFYDTIWVARTHNLDRIRTLLERSNEGVGRPPHVVLDTEAIASLRNASHAALQAEETFDLDAAIMHEFVNAQWCHRIVAVNAAEAQKLRDLGFTDVTVIGHLRESQPASRDFLARAGLLFVGAMHQTSSPNFDGLSWFVREVLPLLEQELGWETRLTVAGYAAPDASLDQLRMHPRITLRGTVAELDKLYDTHRIFIAPTRFAAGSPYKVHEAASFGVPVVGTELLRRQLGWTSGRELLAADASDPVAFAKQILTLYRDSALWQTLRANALNRIHQENNRSDYEQAIRSVLEA